MSKTYVVWSGRVPGIYTNWPACEAQVKGFPGARYKGFQSYQEATAAFAYKGCEGVPNKVPAPPAGVGRPSPPYLTVDAAYSHATHILEWRGVYVDSDGSQSEVFRSRPHQGGSANVGEFLALMEGLAYLDSAKLNAPIYSDSITAQAWLRNRAHKCTLTLTGTLKDTFEKAMIFVLSPDMTRILTSVQVHDWKSKLWGEIPADFGRK